MEGQVGTERGENKNLYLKDTVWLGQKHTAERVLLSGFSLSTFIIKNQKARMEGAWALLSPRGQVSAQNKDFLG